MEERKKPDQPVELNDEALTKAAGGWFEGPDDYYSDVGKINFRTESFTPTLPGAQNPADPRGGEKR